MSRRARELGALNLGQGFPDYDIDPRITQLVTAAMVAGYNQYAPMEGSAELRTQIARKIEHCYGHTPDPEAEITITLGATEALYSVIQATVGPADEVIMFDPAYDSYDPAVRLAGAHSVRLPLLLPDFRYDWDRVRAAITPRTLGARARRAQGAKFRGIFRRQDSACDRDSRGVLRCTGRTYARVAQGSPIQHV